MRISLPVLTQETKQYLKSLPARGRLDLEGVSVVFVHGTVLDPFRGVLESGMESSALKTNAKASKAQLVLHGDTHIQGKFRAEGVTFVNPGSVGWPSDGDWRPAYAVVEFERGNFQVDFGRAEYDVEAVYEEISNAGIPNAKNILKGITWNPQ